jgi:putative intracellular protease/amidase
MKNATLEKWVWLLIYGGLFIASLGAFLQDQSAAAGWTCMVAGGTAVLLGIVGIAVRARRPD